ncbi:hypothetical protein HPB49_022818 [Dermacentor silvarum]|uniref:Uncharacterized protein n=1 Tax=Dermacentor silvarum TaxID=543639 RepID=A0ACB8D0Y6_DERSI|nr:hypothetical protein HPB49_022818 [Dermacentor silvarum]
MRRKDRTQALTTISAMSMLQCVNMFNLVYLFMRYEELLPAQAQQLRNQVESVMPDVKNLDKYMDRRDGVIFVSLFAAISVLFDYVLYLGVDSQKPRLILCAWTWGIIDSSFDAAIGIASGNMSFMDHLHGKSIQRLGAAPEVRSPLTPATPAEKGPPNNETVSSARAPREQVIDYQSTIVDHEAYRLTQEQSTVLLLYVLFRLIFKVVALAGIKDFASRVAIECEKRNLALQLGYEAETVSLEEPAVPGPPKSRKIAMPVPQDLPAPKALPPPVVPHFIPGMPGIPFPPPPGFIAQPPPDGKEPPDGKGPPPPPGMLAASDTRSPAPPGFLFPPPSVVPYPTVDPTSFGNRPY